MLIREMAVCSGWRDTGYIARWVKVPGQVIGTGTGNCSWGRWEEGAGLIQGGRGDVLGEGGGYGAGVGDHGGKYRGASGLWGMIPGRGGGR